MGGGESHFWYVVAVCNSRLAIADDAVYLGGDLRRSEEGVPGIGDDEKVLRKGIKDGEKSGGVEGAYLDEW